MPFSIAKISNSYLQLSKTGIKRQQNLFQDQEIFCCGLNLGVGCPWTWTSNTCAAHICTLTCFIPCTDSPKGLIGEINRCPWKILVIKNLKEFLSKGISTFRAQKLQAIMVVILKYKLNINPWNSLLWRTKDWYMLLIEKSIYYHFQTEQKHWEKKLSNTIMWFWNTFSQTKLQHSFNFTTFDER